MVVFVCGCNAQNKNTINTEAPKIVLAEAFSEGLAAAYDGKKWGYINTAGEYVIKPQFGSYADQDGHITALPFVNGTAAVILPAVEVEFDEIIKNGFALIDTTGQIIKRYDHIGRSYNGEYEVQISDRKYTINSKGERIK